MKLSIISPLFAFIFYHNCILISNALPVMPKLNELDDSRTKDSNEALSSSEIMPGRFLTDQEIHNMIYLAINDPKIWTPPPPQETTTRQKRFIFAQRTWQDRLQRRHERNRLRNERRRLRLQNQHIRQQQTINRINLQNAITQEKLQQLTSQPMQKLVPLNIFVPQPIQTKLTKPYYIPVTTNTPITTKAPTATTTTTTTTPKATTTTEVTTTTTSTTTTTKKPHEQQKANHIPPGFQQVPLPFGRK